jgi:hypothetical protein
MVLIRKKADNCIKLDSGHFQIKLFLPVNFILFLGGY